SAFNPSSLSISRISNYSMFLVRRPARVQLIRPVLPLFFFLLVPRPPRSTLFPYTTLFRARARRPVPGRRRNEGMIPPVRMEPSVPFAVPSREALALLRILVVAGEGGSGGGLLQNLRQWADDGRLEIDTAPDLPRAVRQLSGQRWDVVLAVLGEHPDDDLSWWVDTLRGATGSPRLIAVAQAPSMGLVLRAEKSGVLDVLSLPLRREELVRALERLRSVASETAVPLPLVEPHAVGPYALVGQSPAMLDVYKLLARVAGSSATVLVQGESGTGKEVVARAIHLNGPHASGAFVAVNCAAIPENLLESELF